MFFKTPWQAVCNESLQDIPYRRRQHNWAVASHVWWMHPSDGSIWGTAPRTPSARIAVTSSRAGCHQGYSTEPITPSICCLGVVRVDVLGHRRSMTALLESPSLLRPLVFEYSWANAEIFTRSLAYTRPLYSKHFPVVWDSIPDKERSVDHACLASLDL